ncbi:MAG: hypothetical protein AB8E15_03155, partial [Bdellovibrionales bacterium]
MSFIFNIETLEQLNTLDKIGVTKVILSCKELSRDGRLDKRELFSIYERCRELGYEAHLDADVLLLENDFSNYLEHLSSYLDLGWKSLRVTDPGLLNYLLANTEEKITWVMDLGNHNLKAIQTWKNIIGDRLNSLVISSEISYETLKHYTSRLNVNTEILGLGPILLFYSP